MNKILFILVLILGYLTLLFFPHPENNFIFYITTVLFFIIILKIIYSWDTKK